MGLSFGLGNKFTYEQAEPVLLKALESGGADLPLRPFALANTSQLPSGTRQSSTLLVRTLRFADFMPDLLQAPTRS